MNHVKTPQLQTRRASLKEARQHVLGGYVIRFNLRRRRTGPLRRAADRGGKLVIRRLRLQALCGRRRWTLKPVGEASVAVTVPPQASIDRRTMASPRPAPPVAR